MSIGGEEIRAGIEAAEQWPEVVRTSTALEFESVRQLLAKTELIADADQSAPQPESMWTDVVTATTATSARSVMVDRALTVAVVDEVIRTAEHLGVSVPDDIARAQTEHHENR
ncbi:MULTISPECIES: hypothetical protein [Mycolicibacterium]|jgi:hypothetical protein|uniref:hypothetical protein n=1 Tax=Mycolicibacterium TaxID=1866885 RepID=UPI00076AB408|nr:MULTISPECIES: hypothetical protein [Mycolicibacterium]MCT7365099.1 hypothetical protein [Mycolicibacterium llatzerense]MCT7373411.1 hypothetical protein [Mycolicibacterium llatzerense]MCX8562506.1 hypothetical protein [Mycolicibacterium mucogenicum]UCZ58920.1 hypothetical protein LHJ73_19465 [Mycolicibacterium phocaicum]